MTARARTHDPKTSWEAADKVNTKFLSCRIGDSTPRKDDVVTDQTVVEHEPVDLGGEDPDDIPF